MVVETEYGKIRGKRERDCEVFLGIPYAKPPDRAPAVSQAGSAGPLERCVGMYPVWFHLSAARETDAGGQERFHERGLPDVECVYACL